MNHLHLKDAQWPTLYTMFFKSVMADIPKAKLYKKLFEDGSPHHPTFLSYLTKEAMIACRGEIFTMDKVTETTGHLTRVSQDNVQIKIREQLLNENRHQNTDGWENTEPYRMIFSTFKPGKFRFSIFY